MTRRIRAAALVTTTLALWACTADPSLVDLNRNGASGRGGAAGDGTQGGSGGAGGSAQPCVTNDQCMSPLPYCVGGACVQCQSESNCQGVSDAPHCDLTIHACVQCVSMTDCSGGEICDATTGLCAVQCSSDTGCPGDFPHCATRGVCVECSGEQDCSSDHPYCNVATSRCVACLSDGNCAAGLICTASMECSGP